MSGTHQGDFMGVPATGHEIVLPGITILRFGGDRVIERWSQADMLGLLVQLGAVPAPG
jgi:predicted ester cyclase